MDICIDLEKSMGKIVEVGREFAGYEFDYGTGNKDVMSKVKEFIMIRNAFRNAKQEFYDNIPPRKIFKELDACQGDQAKVAEVAKKYPEFIATNVNQFKDSTQLYIGNLTPNIFKIMPESIKHIYTAYPEGEVKQQRIECDPRSYNEVIKSLTEKFSYYDQAIFDNLYKHLGSQSEDGSKYLDLIIVRDKDLGFSGEINLSKVSEKARSTGLKLIRRSVLPRILAKVNDLNKNTQIIFIEQFFNSPSDIFTILPGGGEGHQDVIIEDKERDYENWGGEDVYLAFVRPSRK